MRPRPPGVRADTCSVRQVHLAMVRYHEAGRFCGKDGAWDRASAMFHLQHAADLGELEAIVGLGLMCWQLPHLILPDISLQVSGPGSRRPGHPVSPTPSVPEAGGTLSAPPRPSRRPGRPVSPHPVLEAHAVQGVSEAQDRDGAAWGPRGRDGAVGPARAPERRLLLGGVARPRRACVWPQRSSQSSLPCGRGCGGPGGWVRPGSGRQPSLWAPWVGASDREEA